MRYGAGGKYVPGNLDKRAIIRREAFTKTDFGGNRVFVSDVGTVWCHVRPLSGREVERYERVNGESLYMFVMRNRSDLLENDRIFWNGIEHNIRHISDRQSSPLYIEVVAERGVGQ